jgi:hypothetical protein
MSSKMETVPEEITGESSTAKKQAFNPRSKHVLALLDQKLPMRHQFEKSQQDHALSDIQNLVENFEKVFVAYIN